jgi:hypothetical protein
VIHQEAQVMQLRGIIHLLPMSGAQHKEADAGYEIKGEKKPETHSRPLGQ